MPRQTEDDPRRGERIAKLLARAGVASRREIERMIADRRIARDGVAIDTPATVLTSLHGITVDGQPVAAPPPARLFLYHKPPGLLVTERDPGGRPTIYDRLPRDLPRTVPVGRLDLATEGLLLLTTDGGLKRQLELPATGVERTYRARAYGDITQDRLEALIDGIEIDGIRYGSIDANMERRTGANGWIELTLTEGKNREVRRVLEHLGLQVSRLIRTRYGPFVLADLPTGALGEVRQVDLVTFRRHLDAKHARVEERVAVAPRESAVAAAAARPAPAGPDRPARPPRGRSVPAADHATTGPVPMAGADRDRPKRVARPTGNWGTRARPSRPEARGAGPGEAARPGRRDRDRHGTTAEREPASFTPAATRGPDSPRQGVERSAGHKTDWGTRARPGRPEEREAGSTRSARPGGQARPDRKDDRTARPTRHPGEGRGPAVERSTVARDARPTRKGATSDRSNLDPGLRRGGTGGPGRAGPRGSARPDTNSTRPPSTRPPRPGKPPRKPR